MQSPPVLAYASVQENNNTIVRLIRALAAAVLVWSVGDVGMKVYTHNAAIIDYSNMYGGSTPHTIRNVIATLYYDRFRNAVYGARFCALGALGAISVICMATTVRRRQSFAGWLLLILGWSGLAASFFLPVSHFWYLSDPM